MNYTTLVLHSLFYLLGMLSVDLVIDQSSDEAPQIAFYCTLIRSFSTIYGLIRIVPICLILAGSSLLALSMAPLAAKYLHYSSVFVLFFIGLPVFLKTALDVNRACMSLEYSSSFITLSHYAILAILTTCIILMMVANRIESQSYLKPKSY